ncbi:MAG: TrkA family potassium uptake protein [Methylophilaceae bacterium]|nr:NAD-binding protein [Methylophilaceae bacterium]
MNSIFFLILRRLRAPLITLIVSYGIAVFGFTLMPGLDAEGRPWHMSIFEAFYVISYTATTIGFGEIPYAFSQDQRLWMTFSIYLTVISWFYAIGKIIALAQDPALRQAITVARFSRAVQGLHERFYIVCGYGETGSLLVGALDSKGIRVVTLDIDQERINELELQDYQAPVPGLCADAKLPDILLQAGIKHPQCGGIAALTNDDHVNLAVAVAVKLISPELPVLCRAEHTETAANMASFGTDNIINPYELFGEHLAMEIHSLGTYLLHEWLTGVPGTTLPSPTPPPVGNWIVCGYGRFGKAVVKNLELEGASIRIIEAQPELTGCENYILGSGTEARTLIEAGIENAVGIVAGTDNDINNLSIAMTALELKPDLFVVIRKNRRFNSPLFRQFNADITMQLSDIIAHECLAHLISPMLAQFLHLARSQSNAWANQLISRLVEVVGENVPETWGAYLNEERAPAVMSMFAQGKTVHLELLTKDPSNREKRLYIVPLLLIRGNQSMLLPELDTVLEADDRILFCGTQTARAAHPLLVLNQKVLTYVQEGVEVPDSLVWRWLVARRQKRA